MGQRTTIAVAMLTCLTLFSCGSKTEDNKNSNPTDSTNTSDAVKLTSSGQPGTITIIGQALTSETGPLNPDQPKKIMISARAGLDANNKQDEIRKDFLVLNLKLDTESAELLEDADRDKTFINIGCDISKRTDLAGLKEHKLNPISLMEVAPLNANTLLICGKNPIKAAIIWIVAKNVVLENLQQNIVGGQESMISIIAREINLTGTNLISAAGKNGPKTLKIGPAVTLAAEKLSGTGVLQIDSSGSSFKPAVTEIKPTDAKTSDGKMTETKPETAPPILEEEKPLPAHEVI